MQPARRASPAAHGAHLAHVSFTNNSNVPIEVMVFIFYSDEVTINVTNGLVLRHN